jgi:hypothetical protein
MNRRVKAAIAAAQYVHPKLAVVANLNGGNIGERLERARQQSQAVTEIRASAGIAGLIEHVRRPQVEAQALDPSVAARPFITTAAKLNRRA